MRAIKQALTLMLLSFLPVIHGCGLVGSSADPIGWSTVVAKMAEINRIACPELARNDVATIKAKAPPRPWREDSGASLRQLKTQVDTLELQVEAKRLAGERAIAEHERCAGRADAKPTS